MFSPRPTARYGTETQDTFGYNTRSELTSAHVNSADYSYTYDAIGNRTVATEAGTRTAYTANKLNQYTAEGAFKPTFDADGNQTLIKTSTGIWNVTYNAKNRPVRFVKSDNSVTVECTYDTMGRRATKKVTTNGTLTEHRRFLYRGYLQIACCDLTRAYTPALWFITWDPTQPTATRPLAIQKNGTWYTYGWDLTKNICETYRTDARIDLAYTYSPYGEVSPAHSYDQPIRWSSEYHDVELGLVYYNYRHYNPAMGRWMGRDFYTGQPNFPPYIFVRNTPASLWDALGLLSPINNRDFEFNESNCSLKLVLHIFFDFVTEATYKWRGKEKGVFTYSGPSWNEGQKIRYKSAILYHINQLWNAGYKARIVNSKGTGCCPCVSKCSTGIELTLEALEDTLHTRSEIVITAPSYSPEPEPGHKFEEYRSMGGGGTILLADKTARIDYVVNHELGHNFNLQHPGKNIITPENTAKEYTYKGLDFQKRSVDGTRDLMGIGKGLRPFYFALWINYLQNNLSRCEKCNDCKYIVEE